MSDGNELPSVGDLVWVEIAGTYEELATVLNIDCDLDRSEPSSKAAKRRAASDGILVELMDSKRQWVVDASSVRMFRQDSPRTTRSNRQIVTPSPTTEEETTKAKSKRKRTTATKSAANINAQQDSNDNSRHFAKKETAPSKNFTASNKAAVPKKGVAKNPAAAAAAAAKKPKPSPEVMQVESISAESSSPGDNVSENGYSPSEDETGLDRPFQVEYSATGRATCKRCDELIPKGALRVSHVPLFRGKVSKRDV